MKITIVQGAFFPVPPVMGGAVEKIWFDLGKAFAGRGHQVTHVSRSYPGLASTEIVDGVSHIRVGGFDAPRSLFALKARDLIYSKRALKALPQADILVTNTFWLPILASDSSRGRLYVHVARYPKGQLGWYRKAARLQTVSGPIARAAASQSPRIADRIKVIPNFVSDCLRPLGTDAYERRSKQILYVGRVHPEKGIQVLLDAFRNLRRDGFADWELVIVGPTEPRYGGGGTAYYEKLHASSTDLAAVLHWVGPVFDRELLNRYYRTASLFVYPSLAERGETFGLAPLEAMAQGCPPVVSALECFRDFIHEPEDGWIFDHRSPDAAESLGSKLRALLTDPKGRAMAATKALETARSYTLDKIADAYITDFEELLAHV